MIPTVTREHLVKLAEQARQLHAEVVQLSVGAIRKALELGRLLTQARELWEGGWYEWLEAAGIHPRTALRYMKLVEKVDARGVQLQEGQSLLMLYRELGIVKPLTGEGARDGLEKMRARRAAAQIEFVFNYDVFDRTLAALEGTSANPFIGQERVALEAARARAAHAVELIDAALGEPEPQPTNDAHDPALTT